MKLKRLMVAVLFATNAVYAQTVPNTPYVGQNLDVVAPVGQFVVGNGYNMVNAPFGDNSYWNVLSMRHENPDNSYITQIAGEFFGGRLAFRNTMSGNNQPWKEIYHSGNIAGLKASLDLTLQDISNAGYIISKDVSSVEPDFIRMKNMQANASTLGIGVHGSSGYAYLQSSKEGLTYENPIALQPNGGNVGIGTTSPQEKLSVNGKIRAKEVKVETANWPDYVFEDTYKPKTLAEIEKFIKTNKHLPEVPSAKEVEQNGIALGEMNKILLKKIEELTLLLIEQSKKNAQQDELLKKLITKQN